MYTTRPDCRHIFHDGHSCGSPALRNEEFCYFHHTSRKPRQGPPLSDASSPFELPIPEDRSAIQESITIILQRIAAGSLDTRRASLLLRALKLAQQNLSPYGPEKSRTQVTYIPATKPTREEQEPCASEPIPEAIPEPLGTVQAVAGQTNLRHRPRPFNGRNSLRKVIRRQRQQNLQPMNDRWKQMLAHNVE